MAGRLPLCFVMQISILNPNNPDQAFPSVQRALLEPNGLLAMGGCLSERRLLTAYRLGIFPWYNPGEPILWWSPDPRMVLFPDELKISRSLRKALSQNKFQISCDQAFGAVVQACAAPRVGADGTWISREINEAYQCLHQSGFAHSVEVWLNSDLVGGLYGVAIGQVFFGESMFHRVTDASKVAFACLVNQLKAWDYQLIDCQVRTDHLASLGAQEIARSEFTELLRLYCGELVSPSAWCES